MKKRKLLLALPLLCVAAIASCTSAENPAAGNSSGDSSTDDEWWTTTGTLNKDADGNIEFDEVTISLTHIVAGHDQAGFESLIDDFNAEYSKKIKVTYEALGQETIDSNVQKRIVAKNNAPDLVMTHQKSNPNFRMNKLIQPIDECFEAAGLSIDQSNFSKNFAAYCGLGYGDNTRVFDYPVDAQSVVGYYNKKLLAELGASIPTTRDELIATCKLAQTKLGLQYPLSITGETVFFQYYAATTALAQNGFEFNDPETYKVNWTSDTNLNAFEKGLHAIYDFDKTEGIYSYSSDSSQTNRFTNQQALFYIDLPFDAKTLMTAFMENNGVDSLETVKSDYVGAFSVQKLFGMNSSLEAAKTLFGDSHAFMVPVTVEDINKKAAIATFINWFTTQGDIGADWAELGHVSACKPIQESDNYKNDEWVKDWTNVWYPDLDNIQVPGLTPYYSIAYANLYNAYINCMKGDGSSASIKSVLSSAETKTNQTISML